MASQTTPPIQTALEALIVNAEAARRLMLERFADDQEEEVRAYTARRDELAQTLPADDPLLAALDRRILGGEKLLDFYSVRESGTDRLTNLAGGWAVAGRVVDTRGRPLSGAKVKLQTTDQELAEIFGETRTDSKGHFEMRHTGAELGQVFARGATARLVATSAKGKQSVTSEEVQPEPGGTHTFKLKASAVASGS